MPQRTETQTHYYHGRTTWCYFQDINMPGAYVNTNTGELFRVPPEALMEGRSPVISVCSKKWANFARISEDPWLPISKARQIAADNDLPTNF